MPTGVEEEILKFRLDTGVQSYTCQSPYLLVKGQTDKHEGTATESAKRELKNLGDTAIERSKNGNPVIAVATKKACPNENNLYLYPNEQYKLAASKLSNIIPQAITALINAEAGRKKTKVSIPVIKKVSWSRVQTANRRCPKLKNRLANGERIRQTRDLQRGGSLSS